MDNDIVERKNDRFQPGSNKPQAEDRIQSAALTNDAAGLAIAILESGTPQALAKHLRRNWEELPTDMADYIVAESISKLRQKVFEGNHISSPKAYLYAIADNMVRDIYRQGGLPELWTPSELEDFIREREAEDSPRRQMRKQLFALVRSLLPELGGEKVQEVMAYHFDLLEAGIVSQTSEEIGIALGQSSDEVRTNKSRGFRRLERVLESHGISLMDLGTIEEEDEDDQLESADLGGNGSKET